MNLVTFKNLIISEFAFQRAIAYKLNDDSSFIKYSGVILLNKEFYNIFYILKDLNLYFKVY